MHFIHLFSILLPVCFNKFSVQFSVLRSYTNCECFQKKRSSFYCDSMFVDRPSRCGLETTCVYCDWSGGTRRNVWNFDESATGSCSALRSRALLSLSRTAKTVQRCRSTISPPSRPHRVVGEFSCVNTPRSNQIKSNRIIICSTRIQ